MHGDQHGAGIPTDAPFGIEVTDILHHIAGNLLKIETALVVISPANTHSPAVTSVSASDGGPSDRVPKGRREHRPEICRPAYLDSPY